MRTRLSGMVDFTELQIRPHSYRSWAPADFVELMTPTVSIDDRDRLRSELGRIEGGRFEPMLESISDFFFKLDRDERRLFTERNPDLVQWMSVWNRLHEFNPYQRWWELADDILVGDDRLPIDSHIVPPFIRPTPRRDTLLSDMLVRRRSYRNWSPFEFMDIAEESGYDMNVMEIRGQALGEDRFRESLPRRGTTDVSGKLAARLLWDRVEDGRFQPVLNKTHNMVRSLDPDEKTMWATRNPGLATWIGVWGFTEDLIWGEQLFHLADIEWPPIGEEDEPPGPLEELFSGLGF